MKFDDIKNINTENNNEDTNKKPFFNGKIEGEIILGYPRFKIYEHNRVYSLRCFGDYYTAEGVDTNYILSIILTTKSMDTKEITKSIRDNIQVVRMLLTVLCPHAFDENKEYSSYVALLKDAVEALNKNIKGKDIRINVQTSEFNGKFYYFLNKGVSVVPVERKTIKNEKSFPDIDVQTSVNKTNKEASAPTPSTLVVGEGQAPAKPSFTPIIDPSNPYSNVLTRPNNSTNSAGPIHKDIREAPSASTDGTSDISVSLDDDLPW